jgi:hypothetical protein
MSESDQPDKKIIVDEDWKSQVEAEREAARHPADDKPAETSSATSPPLPPPSLTFLAGTLYYQAMVSLGLFPDPISGQPKLRLENARHTIDTLEILWEKTQGNRTDEESQALDAMLHELRMTFIAVQQHPVV